MERALRPQRNVRPAWWRQWETAGQKLGYPTQAFFDYQQSVADDEMGLVITTFTAEP